MRALSLALFLVAGFGIPALAQSGYGTPPPPAQPVPFAAKGTIVSLSGDVLTVKAENGDALAVHLSADTGVSAHSKRALSDIKSGDFVGSAAVPGADGKLRALEVHIFPEAMRGTYEGHHPMPGAQNQTMTNAAVSGMAVATNGTTLTLKYTDGQQEITVGPDVPVFLIVPGDRSWLTVGMAVTTFGQKASDGTITAAGVFVEHAGQKPMM